MSAAPVPPELARPIRRVEYEKMLEMGLFENERVELLYGVIVRMSPKGPPHESAIERLTERLVASLIGRASVRVRLAFAVSDGSEPEPDIAIVPRADYRREHPSHAFVLIEVADSSLETDRGTKARLYAESGVPEYWVVNVRDQLIEVYSDIVRGAYARVLPHRPGSAVRLTPFPDVEIAVSDVLSG